MHSKLFSICFLLIMLQSCTAQESLIVSQTKVNWEDYPNLFVDAEKKQFKEYFSFFAEIDMYEITYLSDGLKIESFAAIPKSKGPHPSLIFNRGGNRDFGALALFRGERKMSASYFLGNLAKEGYVVIGCNYRGGGKSEGNDEFGGKDVNDILNLIEVIKEIPEADPTNIGMYGWSRGGMMTYLALTKTKQIKAAAVGGAPADKTVIDRPNMETGVYAELIPNYWENKEAELKKRSAYFFANQFPKDVPILILHGNADWRVKSSHSLKLATKLDEHRVPYRLKIYEGANHGIGEYREDVHREVIEWFDRFLKKGESVPDMEFHGN